VFGKCNIQAEGYERVICTAIVIADWWTQQKHGLPLPQHITEQARLPAHLRSSPTKNKKMTHT